MMKISIVLFIILPAESFHPTQLISLSLEFLQTSYHHHQTNMFKSFRKSNNKNANEPDTSSMTEDFVDIMDINSAESVATNINETSAIRVKITPKHKTIGLDAPHTSTELCTTMTARDLPEDDDFARISLSLWTFPVP